MGWVPDPDGYQIWFNRDEQWARPPSLDPRLETDEQVAGICARDSQAGGTWLFTNTAGITLAVMNYYDGKATFRTGSSSRGALPLLAKKGRTMREIETLVREQEWSSFAPCRLVLLGVGEKVQGWIWNGLILSPDAVSSSAFLTTSSFETERVCAIRNRRFASLQKGSFFDIFDDVDSDFPAAGIYMERSDAGTVSQTWVKVTAEEISLAVRRRGEEYRTVTAKR